MPGAASLLLRALLPTSCLLCGVGSDEALCPCCANPLPQDRQDRGPLQQEWRDAAPPQLRQLNTDSAAGQLGGPCLREPRAFDATVVIGAYALPLEQLMLQLKF